MVRPGTLACMLPYHGTASCGGDGSFYEGLGAILLTRLGEMTTDDTNPFDWVLDEVRWQQSIRRSSLIWVVGSCGMSCLDCSWAIDEWIGMKVLQQSSDFRLTIDARFLAGL